MDDVAVLEQSMVEKVITAGGGAAALARKLTELALERGDKPITTSGVCQWKRVPTDRVADVETITGIAREKIRPSIFKRAARA
jgi:hypothetical protein